MKTFMMTLCTCLLVSGAFAQRISVAEIQETRSTGDSFFGNRCTVKLRLAGDDVRRYKYVKLNALTEAEDDQGLDLQNTSDWDFVYRIIEGATADVELTLLPASRKAEVISKLSGEIMLFSPSEATGSLINVAGFQSKTNTNLLPAKSPFQMVYLTKEAYENFVKTNKQKTEAELKKLPEATRALTQAMLGIADIFNYYVSDDPNQLMFLITGDRSKMVAVTFTDENGQKINGNGSSIGGDGLAIYYFSEKPSPKWKMSVMLETEKAVKKLPFNFKDVDLP